MISRRRILSRSASDGQQDSSDAYQCEGDVWFNQEKFIEDHIQEVLFKWDQIDDEIWAKIICMERNHRVAKAYARSAILNINGSDHGFSDSHIGLNGFNNARDKRVNFVKQYVRQGIRLRVEQSGDIIIERLNKSNVFVKSCDSLNLSANNHILLEYQKPVKLFDMKKFRADVTQELNTASYPDRKILERKCVSCVSFVQDSAQLLQTPIWCLVINILALDLLKSKLPTPDIKLSKAYKSKTADQINGNNIRQVLNLQNISSNGNDRYNDCDNQWLTFVDSEKNSLPNYIINSSNPNSDDMQYMRIKARLPNFAKSRASFAFPTEDKKPLKTDQLAEKVGEGRFVDIKLDDLFDRSLMNGNQVRKFRIPSSALKPKRKSS